MSSDRLPVLVAGHQLTSRVDTWREAPSPLDLLERVATGACEQAGPGVAGAIDMIVTLPPGDWTESNPGAALAERLGTPVRRSAITGHGGEIGVQALNWIATEILHGRAGTTVLASSHTMRTTELAARDGAAIRWPGDGHGEPEPFHTDDRKATHEAEDAAGLTMPIHLYPVIENALRAERGIGLEEHRRLMGRLFAPFTEVAARNPHAWFPTARTPEELVTPGPANRMVCFPYTKLLNAMLTVDQAAAIVVTSVAEARRLGIPEDRWVHWWGGGAAVEPAYALSTRPNLAESVAMRDAHTATLRNAQVDVDELARFDLYSCFPAAVQVACKVLGLAHDDPRGLTVTGGLPYAGGPGSGYTLHSLETMAGLLRTHPEEIGLVTGNGMYVSKHSSVVLSHRPPRAALPTDATTATASDPVPVVRRSGSGVVDSYTVMHDRSGVPVAGAVIGHFADGNRFVATTFDDAESLLEFEASERVGTTGTVRDTTTGLRFDPA